MQGLWFQLLTRVGWWFFLPSLLVVALPSTVSAFHMSRPPEDPLVLIVAFVAVVVMTIGVIIAMIRSKSDGRLTKKRGPRQFGRRRGRGRS
jgi:hypothetical protein